MNYLGENSARELIRLTKTEIASKGGGTIDVDLEGANEGEANLLDCDTLNGFSLADILLLAHPVGSLYISNSSTDPSTLFGGTWQRIKDMFILAAGDTYAAGSTGGEATHTLTVDEMPSHDHDVRFGWGAGSSDPGLGRFDQNSPQSLWAGTYATGGDQPHNNMPPYITRYVWERTA